MFIKINQREKLIRNKMNDIINPLVMTFRAVFLIEDFFNRLIKKDTEATSPTK
jgi:hypothetical protein